jgi:C1A family cysteine protease
MTVRKYGWKPDIADHRDHKFSIKAISRLPIMVQPMGTQCRVEDQGQLGSCTGHAVTTAIEISLQTTTQYSRLMAYYNGRKLEGTTASDDGAMIRDVIKGTQTYGIANEIKWPYNIAKFARKPTIAAYRDAKKLLPSLVLYERISTIDQLKTALASGIPVIFGFSVPEYFQSAQVSTSGWVRFPTAADRIIGGHAVCAIGYDDTASTPYVWVRNSWGNKWGINGNFKMDQKWFTSPDNLVDDMWAIHVQ